MITISDSHAIRSIAAVATACVLGTAAFAATTVESGQTLKLDDSNVGDHADGLAFADATGVVEFDTTAAPTMAITGQGTCVKTSSAAWTMSTDRTAFNGKWILRSGITTAGSLSKSVFSKGASGDANAITVESGATLYLAATPKLNDRNQLGSSDLHLAGTGYNGEGALKTDFSSANYSTVCYLFAKIILDGDASINSTKSCGYNVVIDTQGHNLTFSGAGCWFLSASTVTGGGNIHYIVNTTSVIDATKIGTADLPGSISFAAGVKFYIFGGSTKSVASQIYADLNPVGNSGFTHAHRYDSLARFTPKADCCSTSHGDITIPADSTFLVGSDNYACRNVFNGHLKGSGTITGNNGNWRGRVELTAANNPEFTGSIHFAGKNESMALGGYRMIADWANLTGDNGGALALFMDDDGTRWTNAQVVELANRATLANDTILGLDPTYCTDHKVTFDGSAFFNARTTDTRIGLGNASATWDSEATIAFNSPVSDSRDILLGSLGGTAVVTGSAPISVSRILVGVPRAARDQTTARVGNQSAVAKLVLSGVDVTRPEGSYARVGGLFDPQSTGWETGRFGELVVTNATLTDFDRTTFPKSLSDALYVGYQGDGILNVRAGGTVTTRLHGAEETGPGYWGGSYKNCARSAVYVDGGTLNLRGELDLGVNANWNRSMLNYNSYGYLGCFNGGALHATGNWAASIGGNAAMEFDHATWTHDANSTAAKFDLTYNGSGNDLVHCYLRHSQAVFGTMSVQATAGDLVLTLDGAETVFQTDMLIQQGNRDAIQYVLLNLNDGAEMRFSGFSYSHDKLNKPQYCWVSCDGGRIRSTRNGWSIFTTGTEDGEHARELIVYGGGAEVCVSNSTQLGATILSPVGKGIASIPLASVGTGYIGSPVVKIEGDGRGATAFARFDPETRTIKEVKITSPGFGYTWAKAHFVENARYTNAVVECTLAENELTGTFTKTGPGTLTLNQTNDYRGVTRVLEGTLALSVTNALPLGGNVFVASGATLNLNDKDVQIGTLGGGGTVTSASTAYVLKATGPQVTCESSLTLNVKVLFSGTWTVDLAELAAGAMARCNAKKGVEFSSAAKIGFTNTALFEDSAFCDGAPYTLLELNDGQTIASSPALLDALPEDWRIKATAKSLRLIRSRGLSLFVR